jgi:branched-chain amino acid transport system substrate-binding protein
MATFAYNELGVRRAAAIHDGDPYTEGLASAFSDAFTALGGQIVSFEAESAEATNVEPLLTTVATASPEFIYYPVFVPLGSLITKTVKNIPGLENAYLGAADGVQSPSFLENAGSAAEGMYVSGPDLGYENPLYDRFVAEYQSSFGSAPLSVFHAHAFDAANLIMDAIEKVAQQGADGTVMIGRQALIDAMAAVSSVPGITGNLTCDPNGDCADPKIAVSLVDGGNFNAIWKNTD